MTDLNKVTIVYVGKGKGTLIGVPARDMKYDEAKKYDIEQLLKSGLYELQEDETYTYSNTLSFTANNLDEDKPKRFRRRKE